MAKGKRQFPPLNKKRGVTFFSPLYAFLLLIFTLPAASDNLSNRISSKSTLLAKNDFAPEREDIATRVAIHLPQASPEQRKIFFNRLTERAKEAGISYGEMEPDSSPDFWGTVWLGEAKGIDLDMVRQLRDYVWSAYKDVIEQTKEKLPFDYRPMQAEMVFSAARREHLSFEGRGLSVPTEAQAAFFSVMVSGV